MFRVEFHYLGEGLWSRGAPPMTQLDAQRLAEDLRRLGFADEARVVPSHPDGAAGDHSIDVRV